MHLVKSEKWRSRLLSDNVWAVVFGIGLVLFVIHNPMFIVNNAQGETELFLPTLGFVISAAAIVIKLPKFGDIALGSRLVYIPLLVLCFAIFMSGILNAPPYAGDIYAYIRGMIAPGIFAAYFFGCYIIARQFGAKLFKPFTWAVVAGTLGIIVWQIVNPGVRTGGYFISPTNYDIAAALLIFGAIVSIIQKQRVVLTIAVIGIALTGAEEGWVAIGALAIAMLIRRDFGKKMFVILAILVVMVLIITPTGITKGLYETTFTRVDALITGNVPQGIDDPLLYATGYRLNGNWHLSPVKPFGYGLNLTDFYEDIPHNIVLILIEQVGVIGALAWLFVSGYCLVKTQWKYAWVTLIALGLFDHYVWTQAALWFWALVGVSTSSNLKTDRIFKREQVELDFIPEGVLQDA